MKQYLPSKLKFIIVVSIHYWSSQISPFEKGSSDFYSQRAGFLKAKNTLNFYIGNVSLYFLNKGNQLLFFDDFYLQKNKIFEEKV